MNRYLQAALVGLVAACLAVSIAPWAGLRPGEAPPTRAEAEALAARVGELRRAVDEQAGILGRILDAQARIEAQGRAEAQARIEAQARTEAQVTSEARAEAARLEAERQAEALRQGLDARAEEARRTVELQAEAVRRNVDVQAEAVQRTVAAYAELLQRALGESTGLLRQALEGGAEAARSAAAAAEERGRGHLDARAEALGRALEARIDGLDGRLAALRGAADDARRAASVRIVEGLGSFVLPGLGPVKALDVPLTPRVEVRAVLSLADVLPPGWRPSGPGSLPFPEEAASGAPASFNAFRFSQNAAALAQLWRVDPEAARGPIAALEESLAAVTVRQGQAAAVRHDAPLEAFGATAAPGWLGAGANASAALGLLELFDATGEERHREAARAFLLALATPELGLARVDGGQYLWFEEYPPLGGRPVGAIAGHVHALLALYRFGQSTRERAFEPLVKAGLATAALGLWEARRPGGPSALARIAPDVPEVGPLRLNNFVQALHMISGQPVFRDLAAAYRTDMPIR